VAKVGESCVARHTRARLGGIEQCTRLGVGAFEAREELPPQRRLVRHLDARLAREGGRRCTALAAAAAAAAIVVCHLQRKRGVHLECTHAPRDACQMHVRCMLDAC
jgi:hypothetical protein